MTTLSRRTVVAGLILPITPVWAAEQEVSFPAFAFNGGTLDPAILTKAESDGVSRKTKEDVNSTEVEQLLVEVFERDKNATCCRRCHSEPDADHRLSHGKQPPRRIKLEL